MTIIYAYLAVDENKRLLEIDYARVVPNDQIFTRMINDGAHKVLTWGTNILAFDDPDNTRLLVAGNVARMHYTRTGYLHEVEKPTMEIRQIVTGKWVAVCNICGRNVSKHMSAHNLPTIIAETKEHHEQH